MLPRPETALSAIDYRRRFSTNVFYNLGQWIVQLLVGLYMLGYVVSRLGQEQWGLVVLAMTISTYLSLIQAGASVGVSKKLNESYTQGDLPTFRSYFTFALVLCAGLSTLVVIATTLLVSFFWSEVAIPANYTQEGKWVLIALTASGVCSALSLPLIGCLQAIHRSDVNSRIQTLSIILRAIGIIAVFEFFAPSAFSYGLVFLLSNIFALLCLYWWIRWNLHEARLTLQGLRRSQLFDLVTLNGATFINTVTYVVFMQVPVLIYRENLGFVGLYGIGLQINNLIRGLLFSPFGALTSVMVSLYSSGQREDLRKWFALSTKAYMAVAAMIWLWFVLFGPAFVRLWIPFGINIEELVEALPYLMGVTAIGLISLPASAAEIAVGRMHITALSGLGLAAALFIALREAGSNYSQNQVATVSALTLLFFGLWQFIKMVRASSALNYVTWHGAFSLMLRPSLSVFVSGLPLIIIRMVYDPTDAVVLILLTVAAGVCFMTLFFAAGLDVREREKSWIAGINLLTRYKARIWVNS